MDDLLVAFAATQTKEGAKEYRRARQNLIDEYERLIDGDSTPIRLGDALEEPPQMLGDLVI